MQGLSTRQLAIASVQQYGDIIGFTNDYMGYMGETVTAIATNYNSRRCYPYMRETSISIMPGHNM